MNRFRLYTGIALACAALLGSGCGDDNSSSDTQRVDH